MQIESEKLKQLRSSKPWSQDELATASRVSVRTIQRAEHDGAASLQTLRISFNLDGAVQSFAIEVTGNTLALTRPFSSFKHVFTRSPPPQQPGTAAR
jgi:transcriptional regulator with XRE-family HTH domain